MALMILMDKLISSLDKGETVIGIFLDFSKALTLLIMKFFNRNSSIMVLEGVPWTGLEAIFVDVNSMSLITIYLLTQEI